MPIFSYPSADHTILVHRIIDLSDHPLNFIGYQLQRHRPLSPPTACACESAWASAASWVQRRRESVKAAVESQCSDVQGRDVAQLASQLWSSGHDREKDFNKRKERGKRSLEKIEPFYALELFSRCFQVLALI